MKLNKKPAKFFKFLLGKILGTEHFQSLLSLLSFVGLLNGLFQSDKYKKHADHWDRFFFQPDLPFPVFAKDWWPRQG